MWPNVSSFNIQIMALVRQLTLPLPHRYGTSFSFSTAFPVIINLPLLHIHSFTHSLIQHQCYLNLKMTASLTMHNTLPLQKNKLKLMNLVTTCFYFCLLSKMNQIQWCYWNCFCKNPWYCQVKISGQHTNYREEIISSYGTVCADFLKFQHHIALWCFYPL